MFDIFLILHNVYILGEKSFGAVGGPERAGMGRNGPEQASQSARGPS